MENYTEYNTSAKPFEMPQSPYDRIREYDSKPPYAKPLAIVLLVALILTAVYTLLHPLDKLKLKLFLFRNCTIEVVATGFGTYEKREILVDGNLIKIGSDYYEVDGYLVYKYFKDWNGDWQRVLCNEEWTKDRNTGEKLLDKDSYKFDKLTWRLKNSVAKDIDDLSHITLKRDAGKIAIVGYTFGSKIAIRFTRFGRSHIDPPWK